MLNSRISRVLQCRLVQSKSLVMVSTRSSTTDYQYLQRSIVPTMHFQRSLPKLPIPKREDSFRKLKESIKPIASEEDFMCFQTELESFYNKHSDQLQRSLEAISKYRRFTSYISGIWFDQYLRSRVPIVLNYNPFMAFRDDPKKEFNSQLVRSTNMLISSLRFFKSLKQDLLEPEVFHLNPKRTDTKLYRKTMRLVPEPFAWHGSFLFKAFPLDMSQFYNLFCSTRVPFQFRDRIKQYDTRHILVLRNGHLYVFDVFDSEGNIFPPSHYFTLLKYILSDDRPPDTHSIATLTSEDRGTWAKVRAKLHNLENKKTFHKLDYALYALVLDDERLDDDLLKSAHNMLHGPSHNRWFDKSFQLIISKDGKAAINFEHAWGDGVAVLRFFNEVYKDSTTNHFVQPDTVPEANIDPSKLVQRLEFKVDNSVKAAIDKASQKYKTTMSSLQLDALQYTKINRETIKKYKLSPDSVLQIGFQMAYYKLYSTFVATYESCSTAAFKHGRTETVRPVTMASREFVEIFHKNSRPSASELRAMLAKCSKIHSQLTKDAAMGQGFDRHLLALKSMADAIGASVSSFYEHPVYQASNHFTMSTSTLFGPAFSGGGFGPVVKDGYGIAYGFIDDMMGCLVSSYAPLRSSTEFVQALETSFDEICGLLEEK